MACMCLLSTEKEKSWLKCWKAISLTREGLINFVKRETDTIYHNGMGSLPAHSICKLSTSSASPHTQVCDHQLIAHIQRLHTNPTSHWCNADKKKLCRSSWEVAKCFIHASGYRNKTSLQETDLNGILSILRCCIVFQQGHFHTKFTTLSGPYFKALDVVNNIRHHYGLEIDPIKATDNIDALKTFLQDIVNPDVNVTDAINMLNALKNGQLVISCKDTNKIFTEAVDSTVKSHLDPFKDDIHRRLDELKKQNSDNFLNHQNLEETVKTLDERISKVEHVQKVEEAKMKDFRKRVKGQMQRIDKKIKTVHIKEIQDLQKNQDLQDRVLADQSQEIDRLKDQKRLFDIQQGLQDAQTYKDMKHQLQEDLVTFYRSRVNSIPIAPLAPENDQEMSKIYVTPDIRKVKNKQDTRKSNQTGIVSYEEILLCSKDIYIQGDPGIGKTTLCTHIVQQWCDVFRPESQKIKHTEGLADVDIFDSFAFLFLISLRDVPDLCSVEEMIEKAVLDEFPTLYKSHLLRKLLAEEPCLIILDGLDEWTHPAESDCQRTPKTIPHRRISKTSTYLTLSRPWKLSETPLRSAEKNVLFEIHGVKQPADLIRKTIECLNEEMSNSKRFEDFQASTSEFQHILEIPIITMQLICIWSHDESLPSSVCKIYSKMIDLILGMKQSQEKTTNAISVAMHMPNCFGGTVWCRSNVELLQRLGKLAFETLFSSSGSLQASFSTDIVQTYLGTEFKESACSKTGILTQRKLPVLPLRTSQFSFIHGTFQEFFAAFYLASLDDDDILHSRISKMVDSSVFHFKSFFVFYCGMKPSVAFRYSQYLNEVCKTEASFSFEPKNEYAYNMMWLQDVLYRIFVECRENDKEVCLAQTHFFFPGMKTKPLTELLEFNIGNIVGIFCSDVTFVPDVEKALKENPCSLKYVDINAQDLSILDFEKLSVNDIFDLNFTEPEIWQNEVRIIDLTQSKKLTLFRLENCPFSFLINSGNLVECSLCGVDLTQGNILIALKAAYLLRILNLKFCNNKFAITEHKLPCVDITDSIFLESLSIDDCNITVNMSATSISKCELISYDLSKSNFVDAFQEARFLKTFNVSGFNTTEDCHVIDLSKSLDLEMVYVENRNVTVIITAVNVTECVLSDYDLLRGNLVEALKEARCLKILLLENCTITASEAAQNAIESEAKTDSEIFEPVTRPCVNITVCRDLESLTVRQCNFGMEISADNLTKMELTEYDFSYGNILSVLKEATLLENVSFLNSGHISNKPVEKLSVDLTKCINMRRTVFWGCEMSMEINFDNLSECALLDLDIADINIVEALVQAKLLTVLYIENCKSTKDVSLDVSKCEKLVQISVSKCAIEIVIKETDISDGCINDIKFSDKNMLEVFKNENLLVLQEKCSNISLKLSENASLKIKYIATHIASLEGDKMLSEIKSKKQLMQIQEMRKMMSSRLTGLQNLNLSSS